MSFTTRTTRSIAIGLIASTALLTLAPLAHAGNGKHKHRRYKGVECVSPYSAQRSHWRVVQSRRSDAGPVLAGVVGGLILGTAIAHARTEPVVVRERVVVREAPHRYYDPYCERWYDDLDECRLSMREHRHPRIVQVIDVRRDHCVETLRWSRDGWDRLGRDWDDWDD